MVSFKTTLFDIKNDLLGNGKWYKIFIVSYLYNPRFRILLNHRIGKFFLKAIIFYLDK